MLTRWDPFREFLAVRNTMDRLLDSALSQTDGEWESVSTWGLPLDVIETPDEFLVKASIPGIDPDQLDITFTENTLSIKGEVKHEQEKQEARYHLRERRSGRFVRSISLPSRIDSDRIEANYENGVLVLHLPKTEEVKPKRISVHPESSQRMIEGKARESRKQ
jgi:HSP20 family protein